MSSLSTPIVLRNQICTSSQSPPVPLGFAHQSKKQKSAVEDNLDAELIQRELYATQARIIQLDAIISDKDKHISILQERVKLLEERNNDVNYKKYFTNHSPSNISDEEVRTSEAPHTCHPRHVSQGPLSQCSCGVNTPLFHCHNVPAYISPRCCDNRPLLEELISLLKMCRADILLSHPGTSNPPGENRVDVSPGSNNPSEAPQEVSHISTVAPVLKNSDQTPISTCSTPHYGSEYTPVPLDVSSTSVEDLIPDFEFLPPLN